MNEIILNAVKNSLIQFDDQSFKKSSSLFNSRYNNEDLNKIVENIITNLYMSSKDDYYALSIAGLTGYKYTVTKNEHLKTIVNAIISPYNRANLITNADLNWLDTSQISDMSELFKLYDFTGDISKWDVSKVINMHDMFYFSTFNGDISKWDVSKVINMSRMFYNSDFNLDISKWDVSNVINMSSMFENSEFKQNINDWNVYSLTNANKMFAYSKFNTPLNKWTTPFLENASYMFYKTPFNQDISNWSTNKLKNCDFMFANSEFNQDISNWNVTSLEEADEMFNNNFFNYDLSNWKPVSLFSFYNMFNKNKYTYSLNSWLPYIHKSYVQNFIMSSGAIKQNVNESNTSLMSFDNTTPNFLKTSNNAIYGEVKLDIIKYQLENDVVINDKLYIDKYGKYIISNKPLNGLTLIAKCVAPALPSTNGLPLFAKDTAFCPNETFCDILTYQKICDDLTDDDGWYNTSLLFNGNIKDVPFYKYTNICNDQYIPSIQELIISLRYNNIHRIFDEYAYCSSSKYDDTQVKYLYYLGGISGVDITTRSRSYRIMTFIHIDPEKIAKIDKN